LVTEAKVAYKYEITLKKKVKYVFASYKYVNFSFYFL